MLGVDGSRERIRGVCDVLDKGHCRLRGVCGVDDVSKEAANNVGAGLDEEFVVVLRRFDTKDLVAGWFGIVGGEGGGSGAKCGGRLHGH